ncbi:hypothetical protein RB598_004704 [Gaeumannomyces tritici]
MRLSPWLLVRFVAHSSLAALATLTGAVAQAAAPADGPDHLGRMHLPDPGALPAISAVLDADHDTQNSSARHAEEKTRLLRRLDKTHGEAWDTTHPRARLLDALHAYSRYGERTRADLARWRALYGNVPAQQRLVLEAAVGYSHKLDEAEALIGRNEALCARVVAAALEYYGVEERELHAHVRAAEKAGRTPDRTSVSQALKHYVRDWSVEGRSERDNAFPCIHAVLRELFPDRTGRLVRVLLPGAGLGRLGHEIAGLGGFEVTNNEWSAYMAVAYRFLEAHPAKESNSLHPFVDGWSHHATTENMFRSVSFPDVAVDAGSVVLVEGDFTAVFHAEKASATRRARGAAAGPGTVESGETFDTVVTHFFIDTARNLMAYLDTIYALLRPGGYWVNLGPLLYGTGPWVQLSLDEVVRVVKAMGFEFVPVPEECGDLTLEGELTRGRTAVYGFDDRALTRNAYQAQTWAARKVTH